MPSASKVLKALPRQLEGEKVSVRDILEEMNDRTLLITILVLTVPNLIPFVNALGITQVTGVLLIIFTIRMMLHIKKPWLPHWLLEMQTDKSRIEEISGKAVPYFQKLETLIRPRARAITQGKLSQFLFGALLWSLTIALLLPIPFFNVVPAAVMTIIIVGLIQRDGIISIIGAFLALALLTGLTYALMTLGDQLFTGGFFGDDYSNTFQIFSLE